MTTEGNRNIVVLGAGSIGASFAAVFADQGWRVTLVDPDKVRLDAARESEGTGLGLALVRAVADRHGAELNLSQNDPQGLRVSLKFTEL